MGPHCLRLQLGARLASAPENNGLGQAVWQHLLPPAFFPLLDCCLMMFLCCYSDRLPHTVRLLLRCLEHWLLLLVPACTEGRGWVPLPASEKAGEEPGGRGEQPSPPRLRRLGAGLSRLGQHMVVWGVLLLDFYFCFCSVMLPHDCLEVKLRCGSVSSSSPSALLSLLPQSPFPLRARVAASAF